MGPGKPGDLVHDEQRPRRPCHQLAGDRPRADQVRSQDRCGVGGEENGRDGQRPVTADLPTLTACPKVVASLLIVVFLARAGLVVSFRTRPEK